MITADEMVYSGALSFGRATIETFINDGFNWSLIPDTHLSSTDSVFLLTSDLRKVIWSYGAIDSYYGASVVINLKPDVLISSGNGTSSNPYIIQ